MKFKYTAKLITEKLSISKEKDYSKNGTWLGKQLGCSPQYVANWKRGVSCPPSRQWKVICMLLKISSKELSEALHKNLDVKIKEALK